MRKFELTDETLQLASGVTLYRIRALIDIPRHGVKAGDMGGWVEREDNLSHEGDAWVGGDALVLEEARIVENALIKMSARVSGSAFILGNVCISGTARLSGFAIVSS